MLIVQTDADTASTSTNSTSLELEKTGSLIVPIEEYLRKVEPEYRQLTRDHSLSGFPDLFKPIKVENDGETTVPELVTSRPIRIFTSLYKAKYENVLKEAKEKGKLVN